MKNMSDFMLVLQFEIIENSSLLNNNQVHVLPIPKTALAQRSQNLADDYAHNKSYFRVLAYLTKIEMSKYTPLNPLKHTF